jgi:hypothetical protein
MAQVQKKRFMGEGDNPWFKLDAQQFVKKLVFMAYNQ